MVADVAAQRADSLGGDLVGGSDAASAGGSGSKDGVRRGRGASTKNHNVSG
jgi:hypothetical protein